MVELGLALVGVGLVILGFVWGLLYARLPMPVELPKVEPVAGVEQPLVRSERVIERVVERPRLVGEPWRAVFLSGSGRRKLGEGKFSGRRRPTMSYVGVDGLVGDFVASGQRADGVWEYRRVGVQRK